MSKTVTRAMTVMMVGLVAMLATKAEAHSKYVKPIGVYYCPPSVCVGGHTDEAEPVNPGHTEIAEVRLEVPSKGIQKLCKGTIEYPPVSLSLTLLARKQIGDITHVTVTDIDKGDIIAQGRQGTVVFITPDSSLGRYMPCDDRSIPSAVLFVEFVVRGKTFAQLKSGACDSAAPVPALCSPVAGSTFELTCTSKFDLIANPPSNGALYDCK